MVFLNFYLGAGTCKSVSFEYKGPKKVCVFTLCILVLHCKLPCAECLLWKHHHHHLGTSASLSFCSGDQLHHGVGSAKPTREIHWTALRKSKASQTRGPFWTESMGNTLPGKRASVLQSPFCCIFLSCKAPHCKVDSFIIFVLSPLDC